MLLNIIHALLILVFIFILIKSKSTKDIRFYKRYISICKKFIKIFNDEKKIINNPPFFSICIPVYNMQKYIESSILSILNQSFRDFEIIIINDFSIDKSEKLIKKMQFKNPQIRLINHEDNYGVYKSRANAIRNSRGNYIIFLDPDDLFSNPNLLKDLYEFNLNYNEDIIEFTVLMHEENHILYYSSDHRINHFHNFKEKIIYHPNLSNILFFEANNYTDIFCRCIWNKMIRKEILIRTINFLGNNVYNKKHFDYAEDTIINILNFEFASNYSNLNLIGYMYNVRKDSISHTNEEKGKNLKNALCMFFFYQLFYKYIKCFNKDLNYLYYDLKVFDYYLYYIKKYRADYHDKSKIINFYHLLMKEANISYGFKRYAKQFIIDFMQNTS